MFFIRGNLYKKENMERSKRIDKIFCRILRFFFSQENRLTNTGSDDPLWQLYCKRLYISVYGIFMTNLGRRQSYNSGL